MPRTLPPVTGDELAQLRGFLDLHRDTLRRKTEGLSAEQLATPLAPSDLTLGGMLKHAALNEAWWFPCFYGGEDWPEPWASVDWEADEDWDWHSAADDTYEDLRALHDAAVARADEVVAGAVGVDSLSVRTRDGEPRNLRWILLHMIEEYARHNGHADLIRQSLDGAVGE